MDVWGWLRHLVGCGGVGVPGCRCLPWVGPGYRDPVLTGHVHTLWGYATSCKPAGTELLISASQ